MQPLTALLPAIEQDTCIRRFCAADVAGFYAYRSDEELARFQGWSKMDEEGARQFVLEMASVQTMIAGDWVQLAVAESTSNALLGDLGLYLEADGSAGELGFTLARSAQGQGHAVRAARQAVLLMFAASDAQVVRAITDVRNVKSVRVLERVGFVRVEEREAVFKGEPCTEFVYVYHRADALRL